MGIIKYRAGGYLRLSDKDLHLDPHEQSESIENQKAIILSYLEKHPEIELVDFFIDDGYTGLNYDREGFQCLMDQIDAGQINMIITKELSRLGREHAETIQLFKKDFVLKKIRYVAVLDNIDFNGRIEGMDIPFKVMVNDYYSQSLSNTVTNTLRNMQRQGKYVGAFTSYGYKKDPNDKHKLVVDEEAGVVVKKIYAMFLEGYSIQQICRKLTAEGEPMPLKYKQQSTNYQCKKTLASTNYWTYTSVWRILKSKIYLGTLVQHQYEKIAYNLPGIQKVSKEEVIEIPNAHEALVTQKDWDAVQELLRTKRRVGEKKGQESIFAGIIKCGDCKRSLGRTRMRREIRYFYRCNTYARMGKEFCSMHRIMEETLEEIVLQAIRKTAIETEEFQCMEVDSEILYGRIHTRNNDILVKYQQRLEAAEQERSRMVLKLAKGIITEQDFLLYKEQYEEEKQQLQFKIYDLQKQINNDKILNKRYQEWVEEFVVHKHLGKLTRQIVLHLIKEIRVFEGNRIEIEFHFQNPFG